MIKPDEARCSRDESPSSDEYDPRLLPERKSRSIDFIMPQFDEDEPFHPIIASASSPALLRSAPVESPSISDDDSFQLEDHPPLLEEHPPPADWSFCHPSAPREDKVKIGLNRMPYSLEYVDLLIAAIQTSDIVESTRIQRVGASQLPDLRNKINRLFIEAASNGWLAIIERCMTFLDPSPALIAASEVNREDSVRLLLTITNPSDGLAMRRAISKGNYAVVRLLLADERSSLDDSIAIAIIHKHHKILGLLLATPRISPTTKDLLIAIETGDETTILMLAVDRRIDIASGRNAPLRLAVSRGLHKVVRLLLDDPRVDPSDSNNEAIAIAVRRNYIAIVKELIRDSRVDPCARRNNAFLIAVSEDKLDIIKLLVDDRRCYNEIVYYLQDVFDQRAASIRIEVLRQELARKMVSYLEIAERGGMEEQD